MTIPTEAIEAAAIAMFYQQVGIKSPYPLWEGADSDEKDNCLNDAVLALSAAAPYISAAALREFAETVRDFPGEDTLRNHIAALAITRADQLEGKTE